MSFSFDPFRSADLQTTGGQSALFRKLNVDLTAIDANFTTNNALLAALGTMSTQDADSVAITGGTITGITDLAVADGGTGASTASGARTALGVAIGTDVQAHGDVLDDLNALGANSSDSEILVGTGAGALAWESGATARASLGVSIGSQVQAWSAVLDGTTASYTTAEESKLAGIDWLTASETLYVATTGSDSTGDGSSGNPFATVQKAFDVFGTYFLSNKTATIQLADGTYSENIEVSKPFTGNEIRLKGNQANPENTILTASSGIVFSAKQPGNRTALSYLTLDGGTTLVQVEDGAYVKIGHGVRFGAATTTHMRCVGAFLDIQDSEYSVFDDAVRHIEGTHNGIVHAVGITLDFETAGTAFTEFIRADRAGFVNLPNATFTGEDGSATGQRFWAKNKALIYDGGDSLTFLPGDTAGTTNDGSGYYIGYDQPGFRSEDGTDIFFDSGNVAIGRDTAVEALDVDGNLRVRGDIYIDSHLVIDQVNMVITDTKANGQLGDISYVVNTSGKHRHKITRNSTNNALYYATDGDAGDDWISVDGSDTISPS